MASNDTTVGDIAESSGIAVGTNNQAVNVTISAPLEPPSSLREQIRQMWVIVSSDQLERKDRQKEADEHRQWVREQLSQLRSHIWILTVAVGLLVALVALLYLGWWYR